MQACQLVNAGPKAEYLASSSEEEAERPGFLAQMYAHWVLGDSLISTSEIQKQGQDIWGASWGASNIIKHEKEKLNNDNWDWMIFDNCRCSTLFWFKPDIPQEQQIAENGFSPLKSDSLHSSIVILPPNASCHLGPEIGSGSLYALNKLLFDERKAEITSSHPELDWAQHVQEMTNKYKKLLATYVPDYFFGISLRPWQPWHLQWTTAWIFLLSAALPIHGHICERARVQSLLAKAAIAVYIFADVACLACMATLATMEAQMEGLKDFTEILGI